MKRIVTTVAGVLVAALSLAACGGSDNANEADTEADTGGMPDQLVWSTYGTGTATYADLAAVADAISSKKGTQIRIITSDTAVGRLTPVREGQADMARTGDEYIFAFEGDYDFATEEWGPQDVSVVWAPIAPHGLLVKDDSDIQTFEDLKGKKFPRITANPSVNNKLEAFLAYGGLTWDDVEVVEIGYSEQPDGVKNGQLDVLFQQVYGASLFELDSAVPVRWLSMDDDSPERLKAVEEIAPSTTVGEFTGAPGQEEGESAKGLLYTVPIMTYTETDQSVVYETVKAINETYEDYKDTTPTTAAWNTENALLEPRQVPYHPGAIQYLEENDLWTEESAAHNEELIERGEALRAGWEEFLGGASPENVAEEWTAWKEENAPSK